jgi:hypothetical protein
MLKYPLISGKPNRPSKRGKPKQGNFVIFRTLFFEEEFSKLIPRSGQHPNIKQRRNHTPQIPRDNTIEKNMIYILFSPADHTEV